MVLSRLHACASTYPWTRSSFAVRPHARSRDRARSRVQRLHSIHARGAHASRECVQRRCGGRGAESRGGEGPPPRLWEVGGGEDDDARVLLEAVHLDEQLVERHLHRLARGEKRWRGDLVLFEGGGDRPRG
eukprot:5325384-Pleurochrysis_carterae.AAC.1